MPYRNTSELPKDIKQKYTTAKERRAFMKAYNTTFKACQEKGKSLATCEGQAFATGHSAAQGVRSTESVDNKQALIPETGNIEGYVDSRLTQLEAEYDPTGGTHEAACANCRWFNPYNVSCHVVQGVIVPTGISDRFEPLNHEIEEIDIDDLLGEDSQDDYGKSFLDNVKETISQTINSLFGSQAEIDDYFDTPNGFKMLSDNRWIAWYTNAYEDRDGEWFAQKAIEADIDRMNETGDYPELWHWHVKGTKHGQADWAGMIGRFAVASGVFDNTPTARKFKAYYRKNDMMLSHGFSYDPEEYKDNTYHAFKTFEISTLPPGREANSLTSFGVKQGERTMSKLKSEQVLSLIRVVGEENARKMIEDGLEATKDADNTLKYKAASNPTEDEDEMEDEKAYRKRMEDDMAEMKKALSDLKAAFEKKPPKEEEKQVSTPPVITNPITINPSDTPDTRMMQMLEQMQANMKAMQDKQDALDTHVKSVQGANFDGLMADFAANKSNKQPAMSYGEKMMLSAMGMLPSEENK